MRELTKEAQEERDDFDLNMARHGCTCFKSAPCSYCTHPGNPLNQEEDETAWLPAKIVRSTHHGQVIRVNDYVMVTNPVFVTRAGYPLSFEVAKEHVRNNFYLTHELEVRKIEGCPVWDWTVTWEGREARRILSALAKLYQQKQGFGGRERKLYTKDIPEYQGKQYRVLAKKVVFTGTYYPPSGRGEDWEPGYLSEPKAHVLVLLEYWMTQNFDMEFHDGLWIEACNVTKMVS